jgi:Spy/CpxP family protein refolding chaperone
MKRLYTFIIITVLAGQLVTLIAQKSMSEENRSKWLTEMRDYKHTFLAKELSLSRDQQKDFFPVYDAMEDEINKITLETRELERKVSVDTKASDLELTNAARALFEQKGKESDIEMQYFEKFKDILNPNQLFRIKSVERQFTQYIVQHHNRLKNSKQEKK